MPEEASRGGHTVLTTQGQEHRLQVLGTGAQKGSLMP